MSGILPILVLLRGDVSQEGVWNGCHVYRRGSSPYPVTRNLCNGQLPMMGGTVVRGMYA